MTPSTYCSGGITCLCGCGSVLVMRRSRNLPGKRWFRPHFCVKVGQRGDCALRSGGPETVEHLLAKQLLHDCIRSVRFRSNVCVCCGRGESIRFDGEGVEVQLEKCVEGSRLRPDLTVRLPGGARWALEVLQTHRSEEGRNARLAEMGVRVAEFRAREVIEKLDVRDERGAPALENLLAKTGRCPVCAELQRQWEATERALREREAAERAAKEAREAAARAEREAAERAQREREAAERAEYYRVLGEERERRRAEQRRKREEETARLEEITRRLVAGRRERAAAMQGAADVLEQRLDVRAENVRRRGFAGGGRCCFCKGDFPAEDGKYYSVSGAWRDAVRGVDYYEKLPFCEACSTECHFCGEREFVGQVASFARCTRCNYAVKLLREGGDVETVMRHHRVAGGGSAGRRESLRRLDPSV